MPAPALSACLEVARQAAHEAGLLIMERFGTGVPVQRKGQVDLVTEVDLACEQILRDRILGVFPDHRILGEEGGERGSGSPCLWMVDPLDGTTNFAHGYPFFAVSVALEIEGRIQLGVVHDPTRQETFRATLGGGAFLNDRPIQVSEEAHLGDALLVTGFPYDHHRQARLHVQLLSDFLGATRGLRRDGAAALDLCYLACGRFDAYWELGLAPWDTAAGALILTEAGGMITDCQGRPFDVRRRELVASNTRLHRQMLSVLAPHLGDIRQSPYGEAGPLP